MKLYIYDHCPYCVKARMIFGLKQVPFECITLLNDDEQTPLSMIGQKMLPILEYAPKKFMPESLDIIQYIDKKTSPAIVTWEEDPKLTIWLETNSSYIYTLAMPRWVKAPLEEFKTIAARNYFQRKKEKSIGYFSVAMKQTSDLKKETEQELIKLSHILPKEASFDTNTLNIHDFHLFAALRSLSIVKDLQWPKNINDYCTQLSKKSQIPLHHSLAI